MNDFAYEDNKMDPIQNILYPTDFSEFSLAALPYALELARRFEARLHCVHVVDESYQYWLGAGENVIPTIVPTEDILQTAQEQMDLFIEKHFKDIGIQLHSQVLSGHPAREILHYAGEEHIDLIVIATHGHSGLASVLLGSVTDKVVHKAPCPVLTVRHSDKKSTSEETAE
jgi:nucleotide-binding universal stress UspA family protein